MTASGESISSANYICRSGLHVKWKFLEIQTETWPRALLAFMAIPWAILVRSFGIVRKTHQLISLVLGNKLSLSLENCS
jgi:hypothetical protein